MIPLWNSIAKPPYRGLPWLLLAYVLLSCLMLPTGGVFTGHLIGYDDQVRMVQVLNWVNGAGWYDRTIMRANPPEGFTTIWSRLVDLPFAAVIVVVQTVVAQKTAALIAATVIPLVYIAVLFAAAGPYFARPLAGKSKARLIGLFLVFTSLLNLKYFSASGFLIGQASHHPWYIMLTLSLFGAAARLALGSGGFSPVFMLGGSIAALTAVGIEGYPLIAGAVALLACVAWAGNRSWVAARGGMGVMCGAVGSLLLLPLYQPPQNFFAVSFAEPSILGVVLVASAAAFLLVERQLLRRCRNRYASALILCLVAGGGAGALLHCFPHLRDGAAAGLSPKERAMAFAEHLEARSLYAVAGSTVDFICLVAPVITAVAAGLFAVVTTRNTRRRSLYFCHLGFACLGGGMSGLFSRYYHHAMTTASVWLLWLWLRAQNYFRMKRFYVPASLAAFVALGPLTLMLIPAIVHHYPFVSGFLLFPAAVQASPDPCDVVPVADYIDAHYDKNTVLSVPVDLSQKMLYASAVRIDFLANYPSHDKFIDNYRFFGYGYYGGFGEEIARAIAARHGIDLVALCRWPSYYAPSLPLARQTLIGLLQAGYRPRWLKPVDMGFATNILLFEVDRKTVQYQEHE